MRTWFVDLKTTYKLALSFGCVLLLTIVIAATGWSAIGMLERSSDRLATIGKLTEASKDLRIERQAYAHNISDAGFKEVVSRLDWLREQQADLQRFKIDFASQRLLTDQQKLTGMYQVTFTDQVTAYTQRAQAAAQLAARADQALQAVGEIEQDLAASSAPELYPGQRSGQFRAITLLDRRVREVRYSLQSYLLSGDTMLEEKATADMASTISELQRRLASASSRDAPILRRAEAALLNYQESISSFQQANLLATRAAETLRGLEDKILETGRELVNMTVANRKATSQQAYHWLFLISALALISCLAAGCIITRQLMKPLQASLLQARRIAGGDLTPTATVRRRDELGQLQASMSNMTIGLRELVGQVQEGALQLHEAARDLTSSAEQTREGIERQSQETRLVATAIVQLTASAQEVATHAAMASHASQNVERAAGDGDVRVNQAIAAVDDLAQEMLQSAAAMDALMRESERIGTVTGVIKAVADQTNLLALNAAIEAARAGEAGRGFAVVADEVRNLARSTQKSVNEIERSVTDLRSRAVQAAARMEASRSRTGHAVNLIQHAGEALKLIGNQVFSMQTMNVQIAAAAEEQSRVAGQVERSVAAVESLSEASVASSQKMSKASAELGKLGEELTSRTSRFKL